MAHLLARLRDVPFSDIERILKTDAPTHAELGLHLEHLWQNADDPGEVVFLFRADNLKRAKHFIEHVHGEAFRQDPHAKLPVVTFLEDA